MSTDNSSSGHSTRATSPIKRREIDFPINSRKQLFLRSSKRFVPVVASSVIETVDVQVGKEKSEILNRRRFRTFPLTGHTEKLEKSIIGAKLSMPDFPRARVEETHSARGKGLYAKSRSHERHIHCSVLG